MGDISRKKEVIIAAAMAIFTIALVVFTKSVQAALLGVFIAGAGMALTVGYVILTNRMIEQAGKK